MDFGKDKLRQPKENTFQIVQLKKSKDSIFHYTGHFSWDLKLLETYWQHLSWETLTK